MPHSRTRSILAFACLFVTGLRSAEAADTVVFGDAASEQAHQFRAAYSDTIRGGLGQPARVLNPRQPTDIYGGSLFVTVQCDPVRPTYVTAKFWGDDAGEKRGRLLLFVEGKQLGVRHLGDIDCLDVLADQPRFPGRFFYKTLPLPPAMTKGKTSIDLEIRSLGRIWGYGATFDKFQYPMAEPSRGVYALTSHTEPFFEPPTSDKQGNAPAEPFVRTTPGPEVLVRLKERVNKTVAGFISSPKPLNQMQNLLLARAYHVTWTPAYRSNAAFRKIVSSLDATYLAFKANPKLAREDPVTPNPDWFGLGPSGDVVRLLAEPLTLLLDEQVTGGDGITRRQAWAEMFVACREWHRRSRRLYTNQTMIKDLYGIYLPNRALQVLDPAKAMPESQVHHYLYQSVGLEPWLGSDTDNGPAKPQGEHYMQLTAKGLTRELGYVGAYGEVLDWVSSIYDATRPAVGKPGDEKIKAQLVKIATARGVFRAPLVDEHGSRGMAMETVVGWRDSHYPGDVAYAQRTTRDAGPLQAAAATLDPTLIGYVHQMFDDNQFFAAVDEIMNEQSLRVTSGLLETPDAYDLLKAQPRTGKQLPMTPGQPDFVFSDEEDGVVAIKNGDEIVYASLYWRARFGVNRLARVHMTRPTIDRDATVWQDVKFDDSGMTFTTDDRVMEHQSRRHEKSRGDLTQALQGWTQPIAKVPAGVKFKPGDESVYAGKGTFYTLRYGPYLIGMNMTTDRTFDLDVPADAKSVALPANTDVKAGSTLRVGPRSTVVLHVSESR